MNKTEARSAFMGRWMAWGAQLFNRAEAHGVDWQNMLMEKVPEAVKSAEDFATPDEYKQNPFPTYHERK